MRKLHDACADNKHAVLPRVDELVSETVQRSHLGFKSVMWVAGQASVATVSLFPSPARSSASAWLAVSTDNFRTSLPLLVFSHKDLSQPRRVEHTVCRQLTRQFKESLQACLGNNPFINGVGQHVACGWEGCGLTRPG